MKISIIHPSRSRPDMAFNTYMNWIGNSLCAFNIEYLLSVDEDDHCLSEYESRFSGESIHAVIRKNKTAIEAINYAATFASGDLLLVVSDDFVSFKHWDSSLTKALQGKEDFCVKTDDGAQKFIITLPILDRKYYDRFGYIYNPLYQHMFCDTEMSCVAWMLDKYVTVPIQFRHNHYSYGGMSKDDVNVKNDATWDQGKEVFRQRYNDNFGIVPVKELPDHSGIVKYMAGI